MKRLLSFLFLPALLLNACKAQRTPDNKSLLWRISGKGLAKPSYLFGTIHLLCPDDYLWTAAMQQSLGACREVCFEMDMDDPAVLTAVAGGMSDEGDKLLKDYFTAQEYARLDHFVKDTLHADLALLQHMKPVVLQSLFIAKAVSCAIPVSYEANIMEAAQKEKKEITGLEAPEEQLEVLKTIPDDTVIKGLLQMTDSFATSKAQYRQMLDAYRAQDLPALFELIRQSDELGDDMGAFLDERNKKWIPRMAGRMKDRPVFFAVGAGHLWGTEGVIQLLRKAGYQVVPVR